MYPQDQGNYNPFERDIEAKPAVFQYTTVLPQRKEHPNGVRVMPTAPLTDWSKRWPKTTQKYSRPAVQASSKVKTPNTTTSTTTTSNAAASTTAATATQPCHRS